MKKDSKPCKARNIGDSSRREIVLSAPEGTTGTYLRSVDRVDGKVRKIVYLQDVK